MSAALMYYSSSTLPKPIVISGLRPTNLAQCTYQLLTIITEVCDNMYIYTTSSLFLRYLLKATLLYRGTGCVLSTSNL